VNVYSAKALYQGVTADDALLFGEGVLHIHVSPSRGKLPVLDARTEEAIETQFQSSLLMYRVRNFTKVRNSEFDLPEFASGIRILARILGAPLVGVPDLLAGLRTLLQGQQEKLRAERWLDERSVVIEAALAGCGKIVWNKQLFFSVHHFGV
jgi:hypothetical protein